MAFVEVSFEGFGICFYLFYLKYRDKENFHKEISYLHQFLEANPSTRHFLSPRGFVTYTVSRCLFKKPQMILQTAESPAVTFTYFSATHNLQHSFHFFHDNFVISFDAENVIFFSFLGGTAFLIRLPKKSFC